MKRKIILCMFVVLVGILSISGCSNIPDNNSTDSETETIESNNTSLETEAIENNNIILENTKITWDEIEENGINEEMFLENLDIELLNKIAGDLQSAIEEEQQEERENPEIIITEGWTRIFDKEQYKEVVDIGKSAMKPLYWILYKSPNNGQYEYLCAMALCEISGVGGEISEDGTMKWSTAKEYLELFTKTVMNEA